jgi:NADP-dependent 3-hydroxy acid dehydrogenase YdfG
MAFNGKVALVTGGGNGMGQIAAWELAKAGATVAIADLNEQGMAETKAKYPDNIHCYKLNVTNTDEVATTVDQIKAELGQIDRLTHAAGIMPTGKISEVDAGSINSAMAVNYFGTTNIVAAVLPEMLATNSGDIILFGSMAGDVLTLGLGGYCASKSAVNSYGEVLIHELKDTDLRILLVCPPMVNTSLLEQGKENRPASLQMALDNKDKQMVTPEFMIDAIEKGIENNTKILRPGNAKVFVWLRRHFPGLMWKLVSLAEKK